MSNKYIVAITRYVFRRNPISFHFCFKKVAVISFPISSAVPITMIDTPPPINNILRPIMLKYAPQAEMAIALKSTRNAKNVMYYKYRIYKKQPPISWGLLGMMNSPSSTSQFMGQLTTITFLAYYFWFDWIFWSSFPTIRLVLINKFSEFAKFRDSIFHFSNITTL